MKAVHLRTEYLKNPVGLGIRKPRFFWNCEAEGETSGLMQAAYQIVASECMPDGTEREIWNSGKVFSSRMTGIEYEGEDLKSRERVTWRVTLWDENGASGEAASAEFEMGLLDPDRDWKASWISGDYKPAKGKRYPVDCFRKVFTLESGHGNVGQARIYATARGVYQLILNGKPLDDFILAPGSTDYRKRIQYQVYDVTSYFVSDNDHEEGHDKDKAENRLEINLGDGWFRGCVAAYSVERVFGSVTSVMAQVEILYEDGFRQTIVTDGTWDWSNDGPVRFADLKEGEIFDASLRPSYRGKAAVVPAPEKVQITASDNVPVKEHEHFTGKLLVDGIDESAAAEKETSNPFTTIGGDGKVWAYDFGQNLAGYPELTMKGRKGQKVRLVCSEILDEKGHADLKPVQESKPAKGWNSISLMKKLLGKNPKDAVMTPKQEITLILSGGEDHFKGQFILFGFQYMEVISEEPVQIDPDSVQSIAVYSDLEETGQFTCSDENVNKLVQNVRWSMKSNFLDVPTDCPTRERLGWTGDAQIFFNTGAYFADTAPFFRKWLRDMEDSQYSNGTIPAVMPFSGVEMMYKNTGVSVGWADAVYLIPYRYYQKYGDRSVLENNYPMMQRYTGYLMHHLGMKSRKKAKENPDNAYTYEKGVHLGEWLEPEEFRDKVYGASARHPEECTAYLYLTMKTMADIAGILGKDEDRKQYKQYADGAKEAYFHLFIEKNSWDTDRQAKIVRPLALGLLDDSDEIESKTLDNTNRSGQRSDGANCTTDSVSEFSSRESWKKKLEDRLVKALENYHYRVGTGFLSTPFLLEVLTKAGRVDTAYRVLLNKEKPGWLYEVTHGATTVWEDWEGDLSRNHYSPGAVVEWLFGTSAGIRMAGENHFIIAPTPDPTGQITSAKASYQSVFGTVRSAWRKEGAHTLFEVEIPANTSADIMIPGQKEKEVGPGQYTFVV